MNKIQLKRINHGMFPWFEVHPRPEGTFVPKICAGTTTRLFKLGRGREFVTAVFTKTKPRCPKYYKMRKHIYHRSYSDTWRVELVGTSAAITVETRALLKEQYQLGYRYVRIEK